MVDTVLFIGKGSKDILEMGDLQRSKALGLVSLSNAPNEVSVPF